MKMACLSSNKVSIIISDPEILKCIQQYNDEHQFLKYIIFRSVGTGKGPYIIVAACTFHERPVT